MRYGKLDLSGADWQMKGYLGEDWRLRRAFHPQTRDRHLWLPAKVPGSVLDDLWRAGEIPDPYFERNSRFAEWVPERTWVYRKTFFVPEELRGKQVRLCLDGVDYAARFYLNGELLGAHQGMFTPVRFEVGELLRCGMENQLAIVIFPAPPEESQVGFTSAVRTHKTRMNYGWDFCPRLVHQGIWQPVALSYSGPLRIEDVFVHSSLDPDLSKAEVTVQVELSSPAACRAGLRVVLRRSGREIARREQVVDISPAGSRTSLAFTVEEPELWWPNGSGGQPLYEAEAAVLDGRQGEPSDARSVVFGIRSLELIPNEDCAEAALPYTLVVNGRRTFIKGWNWVPLDALYGVERPEKLDRLLELAVRAGVNLLRVWGGGLIEKEAFYERCDRLGILVWQEFIQSSSGVDNTPADDPAFAALLAAEARQIIPLRRNHPSLLLWCGGNELMAAPEAPLDDRHPVLAGIKAAVRELDPGRAWLPTTPSGPCFANSLANLERDPAALHDVHGPWEHQGLTGQMALYNRGSCLLHSEFGVEGITNLRALDAVIAREHQWPVSLSNPNWAHLGAWWLKEDRLRAAFGDLANAADAQKAAQFLQYDGLRYAVEADRRRSYHCSGTLPWQFDESYPMAASTSAVDYFGQPKPAYYAVALAYEPVHVSARFERQAWAGCAEFAAEVWASNSTPQPSSSAILGARILGASGRVYAVLDQPVDLGADSSQKLAFIHLDREAFAEPLFFLDLVLSGPNRRVLSRNRYLFSWTEDLVPLRDASPARVTASLRRDGRRWSVRLENPGTQTAFYLWLEDDRDPGSQGFVYFNHNYFCLLPGETRLVKAFWDNVPPPDRKLCLRGWNTNTEHL